MERSKEIYKVTLIGGAVNVILLLFKFVAGIVGHSAAMIADAVHSLSDFVTDIIVILFVRISGKPKDKSHDYGHGKYETLAMTIIGLALLAVATGILYSGITKVVYWAKGGELAAPGTLALWAALLSILLKEIVYRYSMVKAHQLNSQAIEANAWHHRSDALSSIGAAAGIGGAILLGSRWTVLDPVASILVGLMLMKVAYDLLKASVDELTESSLPEGMEQEIAAIIDSFPGITEPHNLRTRRIGNRIAIEAHVRMDGNIPLREAHDCASAIERKLKERFGPATHTSIHMEPTK